MEAKGCLNINPMILKGSLMVKARSFKRIQMIANNIIITSIVSIFVSPLYKGFVKHKEIIPYSDPV